MGRKVSPPCPPRYRTPREVARQYAISQEKVLNMIRSGELRAINVATRGSSRPRYRISEDDLVVWENSRLAAKPRAARTPRRRKDPGLIEYV